mgnify:CR=1 FL=1
MSTRPGSTAAIANATGLSWSDITAALDHAGGAEADHAGLAEAAHTLFRDRVDNAGWWAQSAAVAYEQQIGRRVPGQSGDGTFQVSVSKTVPGDPDAALAAVEALMAGRTGLGDVPFAEPPGNSATEKWRYWRARLADGTRVDATIGAKTVGRKGADPAASGRPSDVRMADAKSSVAFQISRLGSEDAVEHWRAWFKTLLREL